ncbi:hypothetical protein A0H81_09822 [Grifola frondosa]|uniref:Uncharacterized protein n=1 Tax=Grifola frondosa TaxID=5627 RepID=A0A1C7M5K8_GRIFR|nr:hypothetical protein A0H81_09822 [Grifola frondosa]
MSSSPSNFTINASSPIFNLTPAGSPGGFTLFSSEEQLPVSVLVTNASQANLELPFFGTSIVLQGLVVKNCSYQATIDNDPSLPLDRFSPIQLDQSPDLQVKNPSQHPNQPQRSNPPPNLSPLFNASGLLVGPHVMKLVAFCGQNSALFIHNAVMTSGMVLSATEINNQNTSVISYHGQWNTSTISGIPTPSNAMPFSFTNSTNATMSMTFTGTAVVVNGPRHPHGSLYDVTVDAVTTTHNSSAGSLFGDTALYFQAGLNDTQVHTLQIAPHAGSDLSFILNYITVFTLIDATPTRYVCPMSTGSHAKRPVFQTRRLLALLYLLDACKLTPLARRPHRRRSNWRARSACLDSTISLVVPATTQASSGGQEVCAICDGHRKRDRTSYYPFCYQE